ncbi:MAG TPA: CDGSH iron-sulfur domain-containing protein [Gemmatimonadaceae bacterium]|nr:CDGSH iron-sulfur domain-containing protein [Gemmatimonadaceae bacterium]
MAPTQDYRKGEPEGLSRRRRLQTYEGDGIVVTFDPNRCIHAAECVRALPRVFNPRERRWVRLEYAPADRIAETVVRCPTGALHFRRTDDAPDEAPPARASILLDPGGPYYVRGDVVVELEDGTQVVRDTRVALCRCGRSAAMPFCDGSHAHLPPADETGGRPLAG